MASKSKLLFLAFFISFTAPAQTCIIAYISNSHIVLAADSKVTLFKIKKSSQDTQFSSICKIGQIGDKIFYAGSGTYVDRLYSIIDRISKKEKDYVSIMKKFEEEGKIYLQKLIDTIKLQNPDHYQRDILNSTYNQIFICGYENAKPFLCQVNFQISPMGNVVATDSIAHLQSNADVILKFLGHYDAAVKYLQLFGREISVEQGLKNAIEKQALASPVEVGLPVSVVELSPDDKPLWYSAGLCQP